MKYRLINKIKGFSVVELIVILSIFGIMSTVSMLNYGEHYKSVEQSNLAQSIALTIRQAQVYGISASSGIIGNEDFDDSGYAENYFENDIVDITTNKAIRGASINLDTDTIILYEDIDSNYVYTTSDRVIDERVITNRSVSLEYAYLHDAGTYLKKDTGIVDISFERPYPDAKINYRETIGSPGGTSYNDVAIVISAAAGAEKNMSIEVYSIGNISVKSNHDDGE